MRWERLLARKRPLESNQDTVVTEMKKAGEARKDAYEPRFLLLKPGVLIDHTDIDQIQNKSATFVSFTRDYCPVITINYRYSKDEKMHSVRYRVVVLEDGSAIYIPGTGSTTQLGKKVQWWDQYKNEVDRRNYSEIGSEDLIMGDALKEDH